MVKNIWKPLTLLVSLSCVSCGTTQEIEFEKEKLEFEKEKLEFEKEKLALKQQKQKYENRQLEMTQERKEDEGMCGTLYNILEGCYKQGKGQTVEICADLTLGLAEKLAPDFRNNPETLASFSLMCGKACAYASQGEVFPSFSTFQREVCP